MLLKGLDELTWNSPEVFSKLQKRIKTIILFIIDRGQNSSTNELQSNVFKGFVIEKLIWLESFIGLNITA